METNGNRLLDLDAVLENPFQLDFSSFDMESEENIVMRGMNYNSKLVYTNSTEEVFDDIPL